MISVDTIKELVEEKIADSELFVVEIKVDTANNISVFVDSANGVDVKQCIEISKHIEGAFDRDEEDFALEVSSAGIGQPFKVIQQYKKVIGGTIEVLFTDGRKLQGELLEVDIEDFEIKYSVKEKLEGAKRPTLVEKTEKIKYADVKSAKEVITV